MSVLLAHPEFTRTCDSCQKWMYDEETGLIKLWPDPETGDPLARPDPNDTPCHSCPKCDFSRTKTPEVGRKAELSARNRRAWELYHRVQACGAANFQISPAMQKKFGVIHELVADFGRVHAAGAHLAILRLIRKVR